MYKNFQKNENQIGHLKLLIKHGPHWINFVVPNFIGANNGIYMHVSKYPREFIPFDMKEKGEIYDKL